MKNKILAICVKYYGHIMGVIHLLNIYAILKYFLQYLKLYLHKESTFVIKIMKNKTF